MLNVFDVAKTVCELAGWNLTNLKLQKILYILQMFYLGKYKEPLFYAEFEAWVYGPVEPNVYKELAGIGADIISEFDLMIYDVIPKENKEYDFIAKLTGILLNKSPGFLVNYTHDKNSAWKRLYKEGEKHIKIPNEEIKAEYERR